jgi:flagellar biosynthesis GTPase FlhF
MRARMRFVGWSLAVVGAGAAVLVAQTGLLGFGLQADRIKPSVVASLTDGMIPAYPNAKAYRAASVAARVAFVKQGMAWVKAYTESAAFKADYNQHRANARPEAAQQKGSPDDQYSKMLADQRKQVEELKKSLKNMTPDMQKSMQPVIQQMEEGIEKSANDPKLATMMKQGMAQAAVNDQENARKEMADYDQHYPADPKVLIARRLHEFLDETKDVSYDAALTAAEGGKMRFSDQQFESKPDRWKIYYRAGREPMEAARSFAADWLRQLEAK